MSPHRIKPFAVALACALATTALAAEAPPEWMAGCWQGEAGTAAAEAFEAWSAPRSGRMLGISQTVRGTGSVFEYMRIESGADALRFIPQPNGKPPTEFRAERVEAQRVVFSNVQNEFPKYVEYQRTGDRLEARLSAVAPDQDGKRILFAFRRVACDSVFSTR